ncbi:MAG: hypothetical protein AAGG09_20825 [Pseudomonadota bacterium]
MEMKEFQKLVKKVDAAAKAYSDAVVEMQKAIAEKARMHSKLGSLVPLMMKDPTAASQYIHISTKILMMDQKVSQLTQKQQKLKQAFEKAGKEVAKASKDVKG